MPFHRGGKSRINEFTGTEQRMLRILRDGNLHRGEELQKCLFDEQAPVAAVGFHIWKLRRKLRPKGNGIAYVRLNGVGYYQLTQITGSPYTGTL